MTNKVWEVMNDLEMVTSKIVSAREIIDTAAEAIQKHDYDKAETLAMAAYEFLGYYLEEFDEKFKLAWNETVKKQPQYQYTATGEKWDLYDEVLKEREYYEPTQAPLSCDKDDSSLECKDAWNDFWESYYPEEHQQYTEEELNAMCDKASSDEEKEKCREYNLREAEYYDKRVKPDMNYQEAIAAGWRMTDDGIWMPPQETPKKKWILPVEQVHDDYFVSFPDDLLEAAKLKESDVVEWVDNGDETYTLRNKTMSNTLNLDEC